MAASIGMLRARLEAASRRTPLSALTQARDRIAGELLPELYELSRTTTNPLLREAITSLIATGLDLDRSRRHAHEAHRLTQEYLRERLGAPVSADDTVSPETSSARAAAPALREPAATPVVVTGLRAPAAWVSEDRGSWPGRIDQSPVSQQHRFTREEYAIAARLAKLHPHHISPIARTAHRTADARVDDQVVEFKTLRQVDGAPPTAKNIGRVIRRMQKEGRNHPGPQSVPGNADSAQTPTGQGSEVILDCREAMLSRQDALTGLRDYISACPDLAARLTRVRIWGSDYEIYWNRARG